MCSRYAFVPEARAWTDFRAVLGALADELLALPPRPRLAPTDTVAILVQQPGGPPQVLHARWGLIPHWWSKPGLPRLSFNARSEEAAIKPMWRDALRRARCLIPATAWTEWQKAHGAKIPYRLHRADGRGFMFAGLWSLWRPGTIGDGKIGDGLRFSEAQSPVGSDPGKSESVPIFPTCAILTMDASAPLAHVHPRMPVVLAPEAWSAWLDPEATDAPPALELLRRHAVSAIAAVALDRP